MTVPFPPGQQGDDEEISDSIEAGQELPPGEQVTAEEELSAVTCSPGGSSCPTSILSDSSSSSPC